uniref:Uncharacterized protein n=1 Tax=Knipowitschia caucasica TaxID=637954 RepID=A0AAV2LEC4_KNICA
MNFLRLVWSVTRRGASVCAGVRWSGEYLTIHLPPSPTPPSSPPVTTARPRCLQGPPPLFFVASVCEHLELRRQHSFVDNDFGALGPVCVLCAPWRPVAVVEVRSSRRYFRSANEDGGGAQRGLIRGRGDAGGGGPPADAHLHRFEQQRDDDARVRLQPEDARGGGGYGGVGGCSVEVAKLGAKSRVKEMFHLQSKITGVESLGSRGIGANVTSGLSPSDAPFCLGPTSQTSSTQNDGLSHMSHYLSPQSCPPTPLLPGPPSPVPCPRWLLLAPTQTTAAPDLKVKTRAEGARREGKGVRRQRKHRERGACKRVFTPSLVRVEARGDEFATKAGYCQRRVKMAPHEVPPAHIKAARRGSQSGSLSLPCDPPSLPRDPPFAPPSVNTFGFRGLFCKDAPGLGAVWCAVRCEGTLRRTVRFLRPIRTQNSPDKAPANALSASNRSRK